MKKCGGAGTKTLDANIDFEARGLVMVWHLLAPGEGLTQSLPHGHEKFIAAVSYKIAGETPTDDELLTPYARYKGDPVEFKNDTDTNLLCLTFYSKHLYEGTHAQNNFTYIDAGTANRQAAGVWKNFVVGACDVTDEALIAINRLAKGGTQIIWYAPKGSEMFDSEFDKLPAGSVRVTSEEELVATLCPNGTLLTGENNGIVMAESDTAVLLVNKDNVKKKVCWRGKFTSIIDAYEAADVEIEKCDCGVCFTIGELAGYVIKK